jgi:hypothetical protein
VGAVPRGRRGGRGGGCLRGSPDRTRRHPRPRPLPDCGSRRGPRGHGAGATVRGARGHRGGATAGRRPGHGGPGRPRPRTRLAPARPRRRTRRRRCRPRAGSRGLLGLQLPDAPPVALRGVGRARTAWRGRAGARPCRGGAATGGAARNATRVGHSAARSRFGGAGRPAHSDARGRGGNVRAGLRASRAGACDL